MPNPGYNEQQILKKFANDTKIAQFIESPEDSAALQATLDKLGAWAERWGMQFNTAKCHVMHIGKNNPKNVYMMNGIQLSETTVEREIGVTVSCNLKPGQQCKKAAHTASVVLGQITRAFHYRDRRVFLNLNKQYVRPHLEFSVTAWAPWTHEDIETRKKFRSVQ